MAGKPRPFELQLPVLATVPKDVARYVLASLSRVVLRAIKQRRMSVEEAEELVFNLDNLIFCEDVLRDRDLAWAIDYGMELASVEELVDDEGALPEACDEIDRKLADIAFPEDVSSKRSARRPSSRRRKPQRAAH